MRLVAEGVETAEQRDSVRELRCDRLQGYLISKPMPEDAVAAFVERNRAETGKG